MFHIFLVEDDRQIREELAVLLRRNGYKTSLAEEFSNVVEKIVDQNPDLVILDLTLPGVDGHIICRELRKRDNVPIIVVTSRDTALDELVSINVGADDFITKPYDPQILLARIRNVLRRAYGSHREDRMNVEGVELDVIRGQVSYRGADVELTKNELHILHLLMRRTGGIVSRAEIQNELWQSDEFIDDNTLTVNINRLRQTLNAIGVPDGFIQTRRGQGYLVG